MTETSPALRTAIDYFDAWTARDLDRAMTFIASDVVCDAPPGRLEGAAAYRAFLAPFLDILVGAEMIAAFGDAETALVLYDARTAPVASAPTAEHVTVRNGLITHSLFVFDRVPFAAARAAAAG